jgi:hypothetical protein
MRNSNRLLLSICLAAAAACTGRAVVTSGPGPSRPMPPPDRPPPGAWRFDSTGYELLGSAWVTGNVDHDVIPVGKRDGKPFTNITLVVTESDLELLDMTVVFMNRDKFQPKVQHYFRENSRTRAIDLPGKARYIDHIEMTYRNLPGGGRAKVEVWGKDTGGGGGGPGMASTPPPPPPPGPVAEEKWDKTGWTMLGAQDVAGRRDKDVFAVGKKFGTFDQLRVVVRDSDLEMADLVVAFENGDRFEPKVKHIFKEGARSRAIELPGANRYIKDVTVLYGNLPGGGRAHVEVWGRNLPPGKEDKKLKEPQKNK